MPAGQRSVCRTNTTVRQVTNTCGVSSTVHVTRELPNELAAGKKPRDVPEASPVPQCRDAPLACGLPVGMSNNRGGRAAHSTRALALTPEEPVRELPQRPQRRGP